MTVMMFANVENGAKYFKFRTCEIMNHSREKK